VGYLALGTATGADETSEIAILSLSLSHCQSIRAAVHGGREFAVRRQRGCRKCREQCRGENDDRAMRGVQHEVTRATRMTVLSP